jgi:phage gpG-like protein
LKIELINSAKLTKEIEKLMKLVPEETRNLILEVAFVDIETFAKDKANIPVDTGRLRASIHTKFQRKPKTSTLPLPSTQTRYNYMADGKSFDGSLDEPIDINTIVVGTNVEYAKKINRVGGGGKNSRSQLPKGTGQNFFDKSINNGKVQLRERMLKLAKLIEKKAGD